MGEPREEGKAFYLSRLCFRLPHAPVTRRLQRWDARISLWVFWWALSKTPCRDEVGGRSGVPLFLPFLAPRVCWGFPAAGAQETLDPPAL